MSDSSTRKFTVVLVVLVVLQSVLAVITLLLFVIGIIFSMNDGIDADKPRFQHSHVGDVSAAVVIFGSLLLWATSAAFFIWRKPAVGSFLVLTFDLSVMFLGGGMFAEDIQRMLHGGSLFKFSTGLFDWDSVYHLTLFIVPAAALCLLFISPLRRHLGSIRAH